MKHLCLILVLVCSCLGFGQEQQKTVDKKFLFVVATDYMATFTDAHVSAEFERFHSPARCVEDDPIYGGRYPSARRLYVQMGIQTAAVSAVAYLLKRNHRRFWMLPNAVDGVLHFEGIIQTTRGCK